MKINGLTVDTAAIGEGLYKLIVEQGDEAIVAFGMIPKPIMDLMEKLLREKIISIAAKQQGVTDEELIEFAKTYLDNKSFEKSLRDIINPISREVCVAIYGAAKRAGKMVC